MTKQSKKYDKGVIYLKPCLVSLDGRMFTFRKKMRETVCCHFTGRPLRMRDYSFFLEGDEDKPVAPEIALYKGFSMRPEDFNRMRDLIDKGLSKEYMEEYGDPEDNLPF